MQTATTVTLHRGGAQKRSNYTRRAEIAFGPYRYPYGVSVKEVEVERDGKWYTGTMGLWREDPKKGWVATVRYSTSTRMYTETIPADRLRELPDK